MNKEMTLYFCLKNVLIYSLFFSELLERPVRYRPKGFSQEVWSATVVISISIRRSFTEEAKCEPVCSADRIPILPHS